MHNSKKEIDIRPWVWIDRKRAKQGLEELSDLLTKHSIRHWLQFGTLLGAMREGTFLVHDYDVDIGIDYEGYLKLIGLKNDFNKYHNILMGEYTIHPEKIPQMLCISFYNVKFDLYIFYRKDGYSRYINDRRNGKWQAWESPSKFHDTLETINFLGKEYNVPSSPKEYISLIYGKDWEKPRFGTILPSYHKYYEDVKSIVPDNILTKAN